MPKDFYDNDDQAPIVMDDIELKETEPIEDPNELKELIPDFLVNCEDNRVLFNDDKDDDAEVVLWYKLDNGKRIPIAALTELLVVTGEKKSRKSLLAACMLAMARYYIDENRTLRYELDVDGPILAFDTEQPKRRTKKNRRLYHSVLGWEKDDDSYIQYNIRSMSVHNRLDFIEHIIEKLIAEGNSPSVIIIDQIMDLVPSRDENDKESASKVIDKLDKWIGMTKCLMCVTIHTNRGKKDTNGKMGALIDQKTDCTFRTNLDEDGWVTEVTHADAREARIPKFKFTQDFNGFPKLLTVEDTPLGDYF